MGKCSHLCLNVVLDIVPAKQRQKCKTPGSRNRLYNALNDPGPCCGVLFWKSVQCIKWESTSEKVTSLKDKYLWTKQTGPFCMDRNQDHNFYFYFPAIVYVNDTTRGGLCYYPVFNNAINGVFCRTEAGQTAAIIFLFVTMVVYLIGAIVCLKLWRHEAARRYRDKYGQEVRAGIFFQSFKGLFQRYLFFWWLEHDVLKMFTHTPCSAKETREVCSFSWVVCCWLNWRSYVVNSWSVGKWIDSYLHVNVNIFVDVLYAQMQPSDLRGAQSLVSFL